MKTREYLDHFARVTADNVTATITARNDDGTYMVETVATKAVRRAGKANPTDEFAIGSRVIISEVAATRNAVGALPVIISRAPREQRGLSGSAPYEDRTFRDRTVITMVDPDPLILVAGGGAATQTIKGSNLNEAPTYSMGESVPTLIEGDPPVVGASEVAVNFSADAASDLGDFDLRLGPTKWANALRIIAPPFDFGLFVIATDTKLIALKDYTGEVYSESAELGGTVARFVQIDATRFVVLFSGGGGRLVTVSGETGAFTLGDAGTHPEPWGNAAQIAVHLSSPLGEVICYGRSDVKYVAVAVASGNVVAIGGDYLIPSGYHRASYYHVATNRFYFGGAQDLSEKWVVFSAELRAEGFRNIQHAAIGDATYNGLPHIIGGSQAGGEIIIWGEWDAGPPPSLRFYKHDAATLANIAVSSNWTDTPTGEALRAGGVLFVSATAGSFPVNAFDVTDDLTIASLYVESAAGFTAGGRMVVIPQASGTLAHDTLWFLSADAGGEIRLRGHSTDANFAVLASEIIVDGVAGASVASRGLGWVKLSG